jgi:hypothetical protein
VKAVDEDCWGSLFLFFFGWEVDADAVTGKLRSKCILNYDGKVQLGVVVYGMGLDLTSACPSFTFC